MSHRKRRLEHVALIVLLLLAAVAQGTAGAKGSGARLVDPETVFHRLYVTGAGNEQTTAGITYHEETSLRNDARELSKDLERAGNSAAGSTSRTMFKPTEQALREKIDFLAELAKPGEEVTLAFIGHGTGGKGGIDNGDELKDEAFRLNDADGSGKWDDDDEALTDDELAEMVKAFQPGVTQVFIFQSCWGGGFTGGANDIKESDDVAVIGSKTKCDIDPPGPFGAFVETIFESAADGAGEKEADVNKDGVVTAVELKNWLKNSEGHPLGIPDDNPPKKIDLTFKSGKCLCERFGGGRFPLPNLKPGGDPFNRGEVELIRGRRFEKNSVVSLKLFDEDRTFRARAHTGPRGSFAERVLIERPPPGTYVLQARDQEGFRDWDLVRVRP
jgi:caspase domain-containing protein